MCSYRVGGLEFTAKSPDALATTKWNKDTTYAVSDLVVHDDVIYKAEKVNENKDPSADDGTNWVEFSFESANKATFNISEDSNLLDARSAIIAYGHAPEEWNADTTYAVSDKVFLGDDVIGYDVYEANNINSSIT